MRSSCLLIMVLLHPSLSIAAEDQDQPQQQEDQGPPQPDLLDHSGGAEHQLVKTFVKDEEHIWTSPFRGSSYSSRAFTKYVLPFTFITALDSPH